MIDKVKTSFFYYPYPLLFPLNKINDIYIADLKDTLLMKILAIIQRGSKKDFIDVYFIMNELKLKKSELLKLFNLKYGNYNILIIYKVLIYFDDAENELMPEMIKKVDWNEVKNFFLKEFCKNLK